MKLFDNDISLKYDKIVTFSFDEQMKVHQWMQSRMPSSLMNK